MTRHPATAIDDDSGSTLLLTIFYGFLSLVLILLVVAASSLYLERKRLFSLADGAALAGAEAFDLADVRPVAAGIRPELDSAQVGDAVEEYLTAAPSAAGFDGLTVTRAASDDGISATVSLASYWRPPMLSLLVPPGIRIEVTAVGRSVFR